MKRSNESRCSSKQQQTNCVHTRNSRSQINQLCSNLTSIIPPQHFQNSVDMLSHADQIEQATNYIVGLRERVDNLNNRKKQLQMMVNQEGASSSSNQNTSLNDATMANSRLPIIEVKELGSNLEVQLVMKSENDIMLHEVIRVLEEEGAEVVNATFSTSGNNIVHTLHAKARSARVGVETSRVRERLHELI